jgi:hypothetical protein
MKGIYYPIAQHLVQFCKEGDFIIWRDAFRWKRHIPANYHFANIPYELYYGQDVAPQDDPVLSNHYDGMELEQLAEEFGYEIEWCYNLKHVAIVRKVV